MEAVNRLSAARRVVVKIGSALLVDAETGALRAGWLKGLAADVAALRTRGTEVVLVSSGAIALGRRALGLKPGALALEENQAAAAVGLAAYLALTLGFAFCLHRLIERPTREAMRVWVDRRMPSKPAPVRAPSAMTSPPPGR